MAKIIKAPLEMANGRMVRNIEEIKEHFDIEKVVGYFLDGKLQKWLQARGYEEELEQVNELTGNDPELAKKLCAIFAIEYIDDIEIDAEDIIERKERLLKLKQYTDNEEIIANVDSVAFNQEELNKLYNKGIGKIYLCEGNFKIPKDKSNLDYEIIGISNIEGINFNNKDIVNDIYVANTIPENVADLIVSQSFTELQDYVVWTEYYVKPSRRNYRYYNEFFTNIKKIDLSKKFKVWNKQNNQFYSFDIKDVKLSYKMDYFFSFDNKIVFNDVSENVCVFDLKENKLEKFSEKLYLSKFIYGEQTSKLRHIEKTINGFKVISFDEKNMETLDIPINQCGRGCLCVDNKLFYIYFTNESTFVYCYDFETKVTKRIYEFKEKISPYSNRMNYYNGELFVKYELDYKYYNKNYLEVKIIGISANGTKEYVSKSKCNLGGYYDYRVIHRSKYWVFKDCIDGMSTTYLFDMQYGIMKECGEYGEVRLVGNYLYLYNPISNKCYRNDLCDQWNPIEIDNNIMF